MFSSAALALRLPNCLNSALRISSMSMPSRLRQDPVVDHVAHELAQLGVGTDRADQLVERDGIEVQIGAQRVQLQRLVVDHGGAAIELHDVLARGFRIHGHQEIDFLLAAR